MSVKDPQSRDNEGLRPPSLTGTRGVGTTTSTSDSLTVNTNKQDLPSPLQPPLPNSSPHAIPSSTSAAGPDNEKRHESGNGTKNSQQPVVGGIQAKKDTGVKAVASTGGGENSRLTVTTVEEMSDATKKGDSDSSSAALRSDAGTEGTPTTPDSSQPSTGGAEQPSATPDREEASDSTENGVSQSAGSATAPTTNAKTGDTAKPVDSDSSTAVSHTTSSFLLLVVVACAAAAAVVAA